MNIDEKDAPAKSSETPKSDSDPANAVRAIRLQKPTHQTNILSLSLIIYSVMATVGLEIAFWFHHSIPQIFHIQTDRLPQIIGATALAAVSLIFTSIGLEFFPSYRKERRMIAKAVGKLPILSCLTLALASSVGEELLFRGGLQPFIGIILASMVFGMLHLGPNGSISLWTIWTVMAGLILGGLYFAFQSIWPCIIAHFTVNSFSLVRISIECRRAAATAKRQKISIRV